MSPVKIHKMCKEKGHYEQDSVETIEIKSRVTVISDIGRITPKLYI